MAHKKKPTYIGELELLPRFDADRIPPNTTRIPKIPGLYVDPVWLVSTSPPITVIGRLTGKPEPSTPKPRYDTVNRPGRSGATRYLGHDPHTMAIPMMLDKGGATGIEQVIVRLERLMERTSSGEPPVVKVDGAGVPHTDRRWRVQDFEWNPDLSRYLSDGRRERLAGTLHLLEHVVDRTLTQTLNRGKNAQGLHANWGTRTRAGETLYDVARRVYHDPSRASDIAHANPGKVKRLGQSFKAGVALRLP